MPVVSGFHHGSSVSAKTWPSSLSTILYCQRTAITCSCSSLFSKLTFYSFSASCLFYTSVHFFHIVMNHPIFLVDYKEIYFISWNLTSFWCFFYLFFPLLETDSSAHTIYIQPEFKATVKDLVHNDKNILHEIKNLIDKLCTKDEKIKCISIWLQGNIEDLYSLSQAESPIDLWKKKIRHTMKSPLLTK